jgi:hypothetical protein
MRGGGEVVLLPPPSPFLQQASVQMGKDDVYGFSSISDLWTEGVVNII